VRATLIYNAKAGGAASEDAILTELDQAGWGVARCLSKAQLDDCLCHGADVVVVAGGDGTVAKVAKRLAGTAVPMAIVPMGTANNIARSLGIGVDPLAAAHGLVNYVERKVDLGTVQSHREREFFVEGFGLGIFASVAMGLAPEAKCDDGQLDVVLVRPEAKRTLVAHLRRAAEEGDIVLPAFETAQATHVRIRADGRWAHIDGRARQLDGETMIDLAEGAVRVLVPRLREPT
jgi:diacylglycerol kinase family enzyme